MRGRWLGMLVVLVLGTAGCCSAPPAPREALSVQAAFRQVADGLNAFSSMPLDRRSGLVPEEITVVLNVTAARATDAGAGLGLPAADAMPKLAVDFSRQSSETHGNQITLKFRSLLLAEKNTLAGTKSPQELAELYSALTNAGFMVEFAPPVKKP